MAPVPYFHDLTSPHGRTTQKHSLPVCSLSNAIPPPNEADSSLRIPLSGHDLRCGSLHVTSAQAVTLNGTVKFSPF